MKILLTGASGHIGTHLIKQLRDYTVVKATRAQDATDGGSIYFDLNSPADVKVPDDVDVIIHLAANTSTRGTRLNEIQAAEKLLENVEQSGCRFVFLSSQAARPDAPTEYGRTKWQIEQKVLAQGGIVIRAGQVYGGEEKGLFGRMVRFARKYRVLPAFYPSPSVQPIHVNELVQGILRLVQAEVNASGIYRLGSSRPVTFTLFLKQAILPTAKKRTYFIPVPVVLPQLLIRIIGKNMSESLGLSRMDSLFNLPQMETEMDIGGLDIAVTALDEDDFGDQRQGAELLREGEILLTYLLKEKPDLTLVQRYVDSVKTLRRGVLPLPTWLESWPGGLALLDSPKILRQEGYLELAWRLAAAAMIAESSLQGASRFVGSSSCSYQRVKAGLILLRSVFLEIIFLICSKIFPLGRIYNEESTRYNV